MAASPPACQKVRRGRRNSVHSTLIKAGRVPAAKRADTNANSVYAGLYNEVTSAAFS